MFQEYQNDQFLESIFQKKTFQNANGLLYYIYQKRGLQQFKVQFPQMKKSLVRIALDVFQAIGLIGSKNPNKYYWRGIFNLNNNQINQPTFTTRMTSRILHRLPSSRIRNHALYEILLDGFQLKEPRFHSHNPKLKFKGTKRRICDILKILTQLGLVETDYNTSESTPHYTNKLIVSWQDIVSINPYPNQLEPRPRPDPNPIQINDQPLVFDQLLSDMIYYEQSFQQNLPHKKCEFEVSATRLVDIIRRVNCFTMQSLLQTQKCKCFTSRRFYDLIGVLDGLGLLERFKKRGIMKYTNVVKLKPIQNQKLDTLMSVTVHIGHLLKDLTPGSLVSTVQLKQSLCAKIKDHQGDSKSLHARVKSITRRIYTIIAILVATQMVQKLRNGVLKILQPFE